MKLIQKLRARSGETLTETLCAVLVMALSSVLLAAMISAASRMNAAALERDGALYAALTAAEAQSTPAAPGTVTVKIDGSSVEFPVSYHGGDTLTSYAYPAKGGTNP